MIRIKQKTSTIIRLLMYTGLQNRLLLNINITQSLLNINTINSYLILSKHFVSKENLFSLTENLFSLKKFT